MKKKIYTIELTKNELEGIQLVLSNTEFNKIWRPLFDLEGLRLRLARIALEEK